jgi:uncharacterized phage protein (TIGR01671 family)
VGSYYKEGDEMREILFKGKRVDNGEWVYWNQFGEYTEPYCTLYDYRSHTHSTDTIESTIVQFTGLTDKNGVKIFEGDLTKHTKHETIGVWKFSEHFSCFLMEEIGEIESHRFYFKIDEPALEIIGNIYEEKVTK